MREQPALLQTSVPLPLCLDGSGGARAPQVARRLFPFCRGLFEDKVANLWFCADVVLKLRRRLAVPQLAKLALVSTLR